MAKSRFHANKKDGKISIELTIKEYEKLLEDLEELDAIRAYDEAKTSDEQASTLRLISGR